jgi:hypothetical protein
MISIFNRLKARSVSVSPQAWFWTIARAYSDFPTDTGLTTWLQQSQCFDLRFPPGNLVAGLVQLSMMVAA